MLLFELGTYLESLGLGTLAVTLFLGKLPVDAPGNTTPDAIAALVETPGFPADEVHDVLGPSREHPMVQILVRGAPYDYEGPRQWAQDILMALASIRNQDLSGTWYLGVKSWQPIFRLSTDDYGRDIMSGQFRIDKAA